MTQPILLLVLLPPPQPPCFCSFHSLHSEGCAGPPRISTRRTAYPHPLKALPSRILGAPAPPQSPPLANLGCIHSCGQPACLHGLKALPSRIFAAFTPAGSACPHGLNPLANLGCIHCCGQPARTASKPISTRKDLPLKTVRLR